MNRISKQLLKIAQQINSQQIQSLFNQFSKFTVKHPFKICRKELHGGVIQIDITNDDIDYGSDGTITISITRDNKLNINVQLYSSWTYDPEAFGDSGRYQFNQSKFCKENIDISSQMLFQKINRLIEQVNGWYQDSIDQYKQQQREYYNDLSSRAWQDYENDCYDDDGYY